MVFEFAVPLLLCCTFAYSPFLPPRLVRGALLLLVSLQLAALTLRPEDYNSDTNNYLGYVTLLQEAGLFEAALLTKFEPVHLITALVASNFRGWLLLESAIWLTLAIGVLRRAKRLETIAVVIGCALPLYSSSLRYSVGILAVAYLALRWKERRFSAVSISALGATAHASLAVAGAFINARLWLVLLAIGLLAVYSALDPDILERAGAGADNPSKATGLRSFVPLVFYVLYLGNTVWRRASLVAPLRQLTIAVALFAITNLMFPILNRWIIIALVMLSTQYDAKLSLHTRSRGIQAAVAVAVYAMLVVPFLMTLSDVAVSGEW